MNPTKTALFALLFTVLLHAGQFDDRIPSISGYVLSGGGLGTPADVDMPDYGCTNGEGVEYYLPNSGTDTFVSGSMFTCSEGSAAYSSIVSGIKADSPNLNYREETVDGVRVLIVEETNVGYAGVLFYFTYDDVHTIGDCMTSSSGTQPSTAECMCVMRAFVGRAKGSTASVDCTGGGTAGGGTIYTPPGRLDEGGCCGPTAILLALPLLAMFFRQKSG